MLERTLNTRHLRPITLFGSSTRRIRIHLRSRPILSIRHASTQPQTLLIRNRDDSLLRYRFANDLSLGIGGSNVRHLPHRIHHGREPLRRGTRHILHQIKPIGNLALLPIDWFSVARILCRAELGLVRVGRLVQIQMARPIILRYVTHILPQESDERSRFVCRRFWIERPALDDFSVGIEGSIRIGAFRRPSLDSFVSPRTHAGNN
mmetsp:Transcript_23993/g.50233  ORF Transcript_23993/g.50233 Transcript_23993/m.50233 type:complete len:206 (+) Transcript_23993:396-1013(+)